MSHPPFNSQLSDIFDQAWDQSKFVIVSALAGDGTASHVRALLKQEHGAPSEPSFEDVESIGAHAAGSSGQRAALAKINPSAVAKVEAYPLDAERMERFSTGLAAMASVGIKTIVVSEDLHGALRLDQSSAVSVNAHAGLNVGAGLADSLSAMHEALASRRQAGVDIQQALAQSRFGSGKNQP